MGFVKCTLCVKYGSAMGNAAGVSGFISFHFLRQQKISHGPSVIYFTSEGYFTSNIPNISDFAVKIIKLCETIKGHYSLVNQLERSATSIGANIREANYAHGKPDFIAKLQIALKECYETEYWLELFVKSEILDMEIATSLHNQCGTIRRILIASTTTAKSRK